MLAFGFGFGLPLGGGLDFTPNAFSFIDQTDVTLATTITSNTIIISGITGSTPIAITGGTYSVNGGAYTALPGTVRNGDSVTVRHTSASTIETATNTILNIGGVLDTFTSTTSAIVSEIDATANDDITLANTRGPALTVSRAGAGKTRVDSSGLIRTVAANTLLRNYRWNGSAFAPYFKSEDASTNLIVRSSDLSASWANIVGTTPTLTSAADTCGDINLDLLGDDSAILAEGKTITPTFSGNGVKSYSCVVKKPASNATACAFVRVRDTTALANRLEAEISWSGSTPSLNMVTGTLEQIITLGNGCYRICAQTTTVTVANTNVVEVYAATTAALGGGTTGDILIGGIQIENADRCTSLIPTAGSTVTRAQDVVTHATSGIVGFVESAMTLFQNYVALKPNSGNKDLITIDDGTANNRHDLRMTAANQNAQTQSGGAAQANIAGAVSTTATTYKRAYAVQANDGMQYTNGAQDGAADTTITMPTGLTTRRFGGLSNQANCDVALDRIYGRRMTNTELGTITT